MTTMQEEPKRIPANSDYIQIDSHPLDSPQQSILGSMCKCPICHQSGQSVFKKAGTSKWARKCPYCKIKYEVKPRSK